jgi:charged multivesicular body protein 2B
VKTVVLNFIVNDTLDGVLEGSDDELQSDAIVNQVLDEIGIEISGKVIIL